MKKYRAFTVAEIMIGLLVMAISSAAMLLSASSAKQTAQHEAERLAAYIYRTMNKADRIHQGFDMMTAPGYIHIDWESGPEDISFKASKGCRYYSRTSSGELRYSVTDRQFASGGTITVTDSQGGVYYIKIASTEGRIRLSEIDD